MAAFTATVWDVEKLQAQLAGAGHMLVHVWPESTNPPAPTVTNVSPVAGTVVTPATVWSADINGTLGEILVWVSYEGLNVVEMIYDGSDFCPNFKALSTLEQTDSNPDVWHIEIKRSNGWLGDPRIAVRVRSDEGAVNE